MMKARLQKLIKRGTATLAAAACSAWLAAAGLDDIAKAHIKAMREDGSITNVVRQMVRDGTLAEMLGAGVMCEARGHIWLPEMTLTLGGGPAEEKRKCAACGLTQTRKQTDWK